MIRVISKLLKAYVKNNLLRKRQPIVLAHMLTFRCNMRCHYCAYWMWRCDEMSTVEVKRMIEGAADVGMAVYTATGGEPLLRRDVNEILRKAKDCGLYTMLVTNGLLLEKFSNLNVDLLVVSLDTLSREKFRKITGVDALNTVVEAIKKASQSVQTCVNVVLHDDNINEIEDLVTFAESVGAGITFEPVSTYFEGCATVDEAKLRGTIGRILQLKREFRCILNSTPYLNLIIEGKRVNCMPYLLLRVNPDGSVISPCYEVDYVTAGNLKNRSLKEIIESEEYAKGCRMAESCRGCYLLCYAEPSMAFSSLRFALGIGWEIIRVRRLLQKCRASENR
ncbi:Radical SAM domain protein [Ferroglobus placidus DSM 10642]|uniref:Radical SAM domain protein n=1 Tax=Ferroglobus placidus (strain DSM 10642 / AEDII12DO) TaxID=589924 RepID=D3S2I8_FERPA|nr:radical SAM protein [Ferroglobus placidus]ADC64518.1 Radical SAM domain protein [Ferroglobus placidus DSM 10642]